MLDDVLKTPERLIGMVQPYETPGGTIMLRAHRAIESITLDREVAHLKDNIMPRYAEAGQVEFAIKELFRRAGPAPSPRFGMQHALLS